MLVASSCAFFQILLEMGGLCNSVAYNQVHYEISVEQLIVGKLQVCQVTVTMLVYLITGLLIPAKFDLLTFVLI
jgi:hypothetical protein